MLDMTKPFVLALEHRKIHYSHKELKDGNDLIAVTFTGKEIPSVTLNYIFDEKQNNINVRVYDLIPVIKERYLDQVLEAANELNARYRFTKFVVDMDKRTIHLELDMFARADFSAYVSFQAMSLIMRVCDASYQTLMSAIGRR